jgi:hypothetical protein
VSGHVGTPEGLLAALMQAKLGSSIGFAGQRCEKSS